MTAPLKNDVVLGLDVSTSTIGFSFFCSTGKLLSVGYVELSKIKSPYRKAVEFKKFIKKESNNFKLTNVLIEAPLLRFSKFSSANTLNKLAAFNGIISYIMFSLTGLEPQHVHATTARSRVCGKLVKKNVKEQVFKYVHQTENAILWPLNTKAAFKKQCYDMADAYIIGKFYFANK